MIAFPAGARVWIAGGVTDMRCGMNSLVLKVQQGLGRDPHGGETFCFRGRKGDLIKVLWHDGVGMSLYLKRLEAGKFIWPVSQNGSSVPVSAAQLGYLLEGIDWRNPRWTQRPASACSFIAAMSSICSAKSRFSLAFSSSSAFSRLASDTVIPEYFAFQA